MTCARSNACSTHESPRCHRCSRLGGFTCVLLGTTSVPVWAESKLLGGLFMASAIGAGTAATSLAGGIGGILEAPAEDALASIQGAHGQLSFDQFTPAEVQTAQYAYTHLPAGSALHHDSETRERYERVNEDDPEPPLVIFRRLR